MSEQHTPGPWSAKWSKYREKVFIVQAGQPSNRVLARFDGDGEGPDKQSIADARLIAAAPDLRAAMQALTAVCEKQPRISKSLPEAGSPLGLARAAIAKALGK